jgi:hypothetical protein
VSRLCCQPLLVLGGRFEGLWRPEQKWPAVLILPDRLTEDGRRQQLTLPLGGRQFKQTYVMADVPRPDGCGDLRVWVWWERDEEWAIRRLRTIWRKYEAKLPRGINRESPDTSQTDAV